MRLLCTIKQPLLFNPTVAILWGMATDYKKQGVGGKKKHFLTFLFSKKKKKEHVKKWNETEMPLKRYHPDSPWKCRHRTWKGGLQPMACREMCRPERLDTPIASGGWGQGYAKNTWQGEERTQLRRTYTPSAFHPAQERSKETFVLE